MVVPELGERSSHNGQPLLEQSKQCVFASLRNVVPASWSGIAGKHFVGSLLPIALDSHCRRLNSAGQIVGFYIGSGISRPDFAPLARLGGSERYVRRLCVHRQDSARASMLHVNGVATVLSGDDRQSRRESFHDNSSRHVEARRMDEQVARTEQPVELGMLHFANDSETMTATQIPSALAHTPHRSLLRIDPGSNEHGVVTNCERFDRPVQALELAAGAPATANPSARDQARARGAILHGPQGSAPQSPYAHPALVVGRSSGRDRSPRLDGTPPPAAR